MRPQLPCISSSCQFVVSASGDYSMHSGDPDRLVDWDRIEQVRLFCHQIPSCPICLYPPRAGKLTFSMYQLASTVTFCVHVCINCKQIMHVHHKYFSRRSYFSAKISRCGHVYCWSCVLHYLSLVGSEYTPSSPGTL